MKDELVKKLVLRKKTRMKEKGEKVLSEKVRESVCVCVRKAVRRENSSHAHKSSTGSAQNDQIILLLEYGKLVYSLVGQPFCSRRLFSSGIRNQQSIKI